MRKEIVIFGASDLARIAHGYFAKDSSYEVVAFTVHDQLRDTDTFRGLPLVGFADLPSRYPSDQVGMFVAIGFKEVNRVRRTVYEECQARGYELVSYVSSKALLVDEDVSIGDNCFILEANVVQTGARIGNDVVLWSGNHIGHDAVIGDHCFLSSHVVISGHVVVEENCFIGVNATVRDGVRIARDCVVGAGALIMRDTAPGGVYAVRGTRAAPIKSSELSL